MALEQIRFGDFTDGFISDMDISTKRVRTNALKDVCNFEINDPLLKLRATGGIDYVHEEFPATGTIVRAIRSFTWVVTEPSEKEITLLVIEETNGANALAFFIYPHWNGTDWVDGWHRLTRPAGFADFDEPYLTENINDNDITFSVISQAVRISFGAYYRPLMIKYIKNTLFPGTSKPIEVNEFVINYQIHFTDVDLNNELGHPPASNLERAGFSYGALKASGGNLENDTYFVNCLLVIDGGQKIVANGVLGEATETGTKATGWINVSSATVDDIVSISSPEKSWTFWREGEASAPKGAIPFENENDLTNSINAAFGGEILASTSATVGLVDLEYGVLGTIGNSVTLARSAIGGGDGGITISGDTLSGGSNPESLGGSVVEITSGDVTSGFKRLNVLLEIEEEYFSGRLTSVEIYVGKYNGDPFDTLSQFFVNRVHTSEGGWQYLDGVYFNSVTIDEIPTGRTMFGELARDAALDIRARYGLQKYILGRLFLANVNTETLATPPVDIKPNFIRFSNIRSIVEEPDIFPISESEGFGYVIAESDEDETIRGLAVSPTNDLMIFKNRQILVYEVASGSPFVRRMLTLFNGIGVSNHRLIVDGSDYGIFWVDGNDAYRYGGGIQPPVRISEGRIQQYIRKVLRPYLPNAFAAFDRNRLEYWLCTQFQGDVGSINASDWKIFRYSVSFNNWNIMQLQSRPIGFTNGRDNLYIVFTGAIVKLGDEVGLPPAFAETHKVNLDASYQTGQLEEVFADYSSSVPVRLDILLNDENTVRDGNSKTFESGDFKIIKRGVRAYSRAKHFSLKVTQEAIVWALPAETTAISDFGINYQKRRHRFGVTG